jgi:RNA polymerase sigma-70 factor (ECF subfamily)
MPSRTPELISTLSDEELIIRFQGEEEEAFVVLVRRFKDPLTNYVYRFVGELDEANDIVQETFLRVYKHRHSYNQVGKFSTWLYTIASNLAKSELRRGGRRHSHSISDIYANSAGNDREWDVMDPELTPDSQVDATIKLRMVQQALMRISATYREVVILRDIQNMTYEEIAEITGLELGTVKSRINRGRAQLQELLRDIYQEDRHA